MDLAKVTSQGQITIPSDIRKFLGLKSGDKVALFKENGHIVMANSNMLSLRDVQEAFIGVANTMGIQNEDDVVNLVKTHRKNKRG